MYLIQDFMTFLLTMFGTVAMLFFFTYLTLKIGRGTLS